MKGRSNLLSGVSRSVLVGMIALLICSSLVLGFGAKTALAEESAAPTLTLHLLRNQQNQGRQDSILPGRANTPAGAGYIYQAVKLDPAPVQALTSKLTHDPTTLQERLSKAVTADQARFRHSSGTIFYGISDAGGVISTKSSGHEGVWLQGATLDKVNSSLSGGSPAVFDGTVETPSYWFISLVGAPGGVTAHSDPAVIQLPTITPDGDSSLLNVDVYPKLDIQEAQSPNKVNPAAGKGGQTLARSGSSVLLPVSLTVALLMLGACLTLLVRYSKS